MTECHCEKFLGISSNKNNMPSYIVFIIPYLQIKVIIDLLKLLVSLNPDDVGYNTKLRSAY